MSSRRKRSRTRVREELPSQRGARRGTRSRRRRARRTMLQGASAVLVIALVAVGIMYFYAAYSTSRSAVRYEEALVEFEANNYPSTVKILEHVLSNDADNLSALVLLGRAYLRLGYAGQAEQALRQAQRSGAHRAVVEVPLATAYLQQGRFKELIRDLPARAQDPQLRGQLLLAHAQAYSNLRDYQAARRAFKLAADLLPNEDAVLTGLAMVTLRQGHAQSAQALVDKVKKLAPWEAEVWFVQAEIHRMEQQWQQAKLAYSKAIEINPEYFDAYVSRADVEMSLRENELALKDLQLVLAARENDLPANYLRALLLSQSGDTSLVVQMLDQAAIGTLRHGIGFANDHPLAGLLNGVAQFRSGDYAQASSLLERYLQAEPEAVEARKLLASALLIRDLSELAQQTITPLHERMVDNPEFLVLMAQVHSQSERHEEAADLLWRAMSKTQDSDEATAKGLIPLALRDVARDGVRVNKAFDLHDHKGSFSLVLNILDRFGLKLERNLRTARVLASEHVDSVIAANFYGAIALQAGELDEAHSAFEHVLTLSTDFAPAKRNLARIALLTDDFPTAKASLQSLLDKAQQDIQAMALMAQVEIEQEEFASAIEWIEKIVAIEPAAINEQLELLDLYFSAGKKKKASELVKVMQDRFPENLPVRIASTHVAISQGTNTEGTAQLREMGEQVEDPDRLSRLASYQLAGGDAQGARDTLQRIVDVSPDYLPAYLSLVDALLRQDMAQEALDVASKLRNHDPQQVLGDQLYADVLVYMMRLDEAVSVYRSALDKVHDAQVMVGLYHARVLQGQTSDAVLELREWSEQHGRAPIIRQALADGYLRIGDNAEALRAYEYLQRKTPNDPSVLSAIARLVLAADKPRARSLATRAYELDATRSETLDTLGWVMVHTDEVTQGLRYLRDARNRDIREPRIQFHIAVALFKLQRIDEARRELRLALASQSSFEGSQAARALLSKLEGS